MAAAPGFEGASVISGNVPGGAGHSLLLTSDAELELTTTVRTDETYRFENLPAGRYTIRDQEDGRIIGPVAVDGENSVEVDFPPVAPSGKLFEHYVLFGPADQPLTQLHLSLLAEYLAENQAAFGFTVSEASQAERVTLVGDHTEEVVSLLEMVGCAVEQLPADPGELVAAIRSAAG